MYKTWMTIIPLWLVLAVCVAFGCAKQTTKQTLDPVMYPADWPLPEITAPDDSTPTPLPKGWANFYDDGFVFTEQSWSTPGIPIAMACGVSFENPAGWETVFDDLNAKCTSGEINFVWKRDHALEPAKKCINSAFWRAGFTTVTLYETSTHTFILEVTHSDFSMPEV